MTKLKSGVLSFILLFLVVVKLSADEGCAKFPNNSASEIIYTVRVLPNIGGLRNYTGPISSNNVGFPTACPRYTYSTAVVSGTGCYIDGVFNSTYRRITFTPINCPLDDYLPFLLLASGGFGFIILRKRNLLNIA